MRRTLLILIQYYICHGQQIPENNFECFADILEELVNVKIKLSSEKVPENNYWYETAFIDGEEKIIGTVLHR